MTRHEDRPRRERPPKRPAPARTPPAAAPSSATDGAAIHRQRIAKLMARVGLCSRRDAEAWILAGRVSVNGTVLTSPALDVGPQDTILVDDAPLPQAEKTRLFLFHKPRGLVTSDHDPEGRPTVADFLRENWPEGPRTVTIGRLDINTEGLLLLTNDGGLARVLELPQTGWVRRYRVRAKGETDQGKLDALSAGVTVDGVEYLGIEAKLDRIQGSNCWLTMGLREGKNREIKRVLEHIGLEVNRLIRLSFGPFQLLDLPEGAVEEVRTRVLRDQLGEALAAAAGVDLGETSIPIETRAARPARPDDASRDDRRVDKRAPRRDSSRDRAPRAPMVEGPAPIRERPQTGTRKHVSTLRTAARDTSQTGPRKRIERSETADRQSRTVRVERIVSTRESRPARRRPGDERPEPRGDRSQKRSHASPSALGKRERTARSGGGPRPDARRRDTQDAERRDDRRELAREERPGREAPRARAGSDKSGSRADRGGAKRTPAPSSTRRFDAERSDGRETHRRDKRSSRDETRSNSDPHLARTGDKRRSASGAPKRFDARRSAAPDSRGRDNGPNRKATGSTSAPRPARERSDRGEHRQGSAPGAAKRFDAERAGAPGGRGDRPDTRREARRPPSNRSASSPKRGPSKGPPGGSRGPAKPKR